MGELWTDGEQILRSCPKAARPASERAKEEKIDFYAPEKVKLQRRDEGGLEGTSSIGPLWPNYYPWAGP